MSIPEFLNQLDIWWDKYEVSFTLYGLGMALILGFMIKWWLDKYDR